MIKRYSVSGMNCAARARAVKNAALSCSFVLSAQTDLQSGTLTVRLPEGYTDEEPLNIAVKRAGRGLRLVPAREGRTEEKRRGFVFYRALFSAILSVPLLYFGAAKSLRLPVPVFAAEPKTGALIRILLVAAIAALNAGYFTAGLPRLFGGRPDVSALVALGASASLCRSAFVAARILLFGDPSATLCHTGAGVILTCFALGDHLEDRRRKKRGQVGMQSAAPPVSRLCDGIARLYVPAIASAAMILSAVRLFVTKDFATAAGGAASMLTVSCPCALGLIRASLPEEEAGLSDAPRARLRALTDAPRARLRALIDAPRGELPVFAAFFCSGAAAILAAFGIAHPAIFASSAAAPLLCVPLRALRRRRKMNKWGCRICL